MRLLFIFLVLLLFGQPIYSQDEEPTLKVVDQMPRFPGCEDDTALIAEVDKCATSKMLQFIYKNLKYPTKARVKGIEGMSVVQFVIDSTGIIEEAKIVKKLGGGCDEAALEVVNSMPTWIPGKQEGTPVRVLFTLPVRFKLTDGGKKKKKKIFKNGR